MKLDVIGKEVRVFDDEAIPGVKHTRVKLHCYHEPRRVDASAVNGFQVVAFNVYDDSVLFSEVHALNIPCRIDAELEKNNGFTKLVDFSLIE